MLPTLFECKEGENCQWGGQIKGIKNEYVKKEEADKGIKGRRNGMKDEDIKEVFYH
jgi:hypothetical protein